MKKGLHIIRRMYPEIGNKNRHAHPPRRREPLSWLEVGCLFVVVTLVGAFVYWAVT